MVDPNSELFRAKQQVIYYRAEIAQYKNKISELERLIEKEVVRNKYLQAKVRELNGEKIAGYLDEIQSLRKRVMELEVELEEEKTYIFPISEVNDEQPNLLSYFNYTIILPPEGEDYITIYGDFSIVNKRNVPLDDLVICFKVKPTGAVSMSGKIMDRKLLNGPGKDRDDTEWVWALEDWKDKIKNMGEYWITYKESIPTSSVCLSFEITSNKTFERGKYVISAIIYSIEKRFICNSNNKIKVSF